MSMYDVKSTRGVILRLKNSHICVVDRVTDRKSFVIFFHGLRIGTNDLDYVCLHILWCPLYKVNLKYRKFN